MDKLYRDATWRAFNGHFMEGVEVSFDGGKTWRSEGWSAQHSTDCTCEGESLSEFAGEEF